MLSIRFSNRFEVLRDALLENLGGGGGAVFAAPQIVVPSSAVHRALSLAIADRHGICANVDFAYLAAWLWRQIGRVVKSVESESPFAARVLAWEIYDLLGDVEWTGRFPRLHNYLKGAEALRRWDLAVEIAVVMEQYITYRQDWLAAWAAGMQVELPAAVGPTAMNPAAADQEWQAELWRRLLARTGRGQEHPAQRFFRALAAAGPRATELPPAAHVFCLPAIPPLYLDVLIGLGQWVDVQLYVLNPCREYWFDIVDPKRLSREVVRRRAEHFTTGNRLLAAWGKQTQGQIELLLDRSGDAPIDDSGYDDDFPATVLGGVQRSILELTALTPGSLPANAEDRSIEIHVCHSLTRQLEVLQDQLLAMLSGPAPPPLAGILVVMPDLEKAAPLIEAVFGNAPAERLLPYRVSGRGRSTVNAAARALISLLALVPSRFPASALLELLQLPIVGRRFGIGGEDIKNIEEWMQESGIRWGIDAAHRGEEGLPADPRFTLTDGLDRLFLGYALPGQIASPSLERVPAGNAEGSSAFGLGVFGHVCRLFVELRADLRRPRTPEEWLISLMALLETFLLPVGDELDDLGEVRDTIRELHADMVRGGGTLQVPLPVVRAALGALLDSSAHGGVPTGAITFSSMNSLRNVPFEVICVLGLDDGAFPRVARQTEFDLMAVSPRRGDRQRRTDDRNLFLDLMLAARRRFYLSYTGRSVHDNSSKPASVVVAELIETLVPAIAVDPETPASRMQARRQLIVEHPLQAFSRTYFTAGGDPRVVSFNDELREALREPRIAAAGTAVGMQPPETKDHATKDHAAMDSATMDEEDESTVGVIEPFFGTSLSPAGEEWRTVSLEQLLGFFRNPCRFLLGERLGIALSREASGQTDEEPFVPSRTATARLAERLLPQAMEGVSDAQLRRLAEAGVEYPPGALGVALMQEELTTLRQFAHRVREATQFDRLAPIDVERVFTLDGESWRLSTVLTGVHAAGVVLHRYGDTSPTDYLAGWLRHLLLCAGTAATEVRHTRFISRDGEFVLRPCDEAASILQSLLGLYRQGLCEPLPFFPRAAWTYLTSGRDMNKARATWRPAYGDMRGESEDAAYQLAWRGRADPLDRAFVESVEIVFGRLRSYLEDGRVGEF